ncbi:MAG TPA: hypothetical protein VG757_08820 [Devosia sp.]|nr:hypothetical protein [Devosia sp.]
MNRFGSSEALATLLILGGALLLVAQFFGGAASVIWPFFIIVPGLVLAFIADRSDWNKSLLVIGAVIAGSGIILLVQSIYDYYQSWAYAWTLLPMFAGAALHYAGDRRGEADLKAQGKRLIEWSAGAFLAFGAVFELLIFHGANSWGRIVLPLALIGFGALILLRRNTQSHAPAPSSDKDASAQR